MELNQIIQKEINKKINPKTTEIYANCILKFMSWTEKDPKTITKEDISQFLIYLIEKEKPQITIKTYAKALRFFLDQVLTKKYLEHLDAKTYTLQNKSGRHDTLDPHRV